AGFDVDVAQAATEELKTIGYLNDRRYALKYLSERLRTKALSKKALRFELEHKGIPSDIIAEALEEFETDDEEVALRAVKKKFGKYDLKDPKNEKKAISFLMHRGFSLEQSRRAIRELAKES
ncbi:MAG: RecX family transcriptional regulator, partial [Clostridia bacterium]|nr:RecX family transcriptional regulator [Clostridia bacterium]